MRVTVSVIKDDGRTREEWVFYLSASVTPQIHFGSWRQMVLPKHKRKWQTTKEWTQGISRGEENKPASIPDEIFDTAKGLFCAGINSIGRDG